MKYVCATSGIEFETESKIHFSPMHPEVFAFKRDTRLPPIAVAKAMEAVKVEGGYTTIDEFLALVTVKTPLIQQAMDDERKTQIAMRDAINQRERERRAQIEAANHAKLREDGLKPSATRKEQNALLKAYGYTWKKIVVVDEFDPDDWSDKWILTDPDGATISLHRALDEIKRGRDVVRAEIAAREAAEKAAELERQAQQEAKQKEEAERQARFDESEKAFGAKIAEIARTCEALPRETSDWSVTNDWPVIAKIEGTENGLSYRARDIIKQGVIDNVTHYLIVVGTDYDNDGYWNLYRQVDDTQLWSSGD